MRSVAAARGTYLNGRAASLILVGSEVRKVDSKGQERVNFT